ncbi:monocarboxylate transporter 14-like [Haliotis rufescens]|uniref:monocarboxylate transporter 14-like n=1 Tax=Haliotis rufescens TaxID=6454 RepID=UPI001EAFE01B|nr:monocarboxylate transporter 14-like [Haliotis rufescens]XP_046341095.1 monocarboxylate transporter 14-like [Haliotis rufescens]XP_046341096.1 monocarboxylate transporter 14-like [Haliotis rufescens]XP_048249952.1 monocarboxylate transporter 14-like [Haliotis rufescens]
MPSKEKKNGLQNGQDEYMASTNEVDAYIPTPPDGGWGWVIVAASLVCNIIVDGIGYTFGIFLLEFTTFFKESKSKVALVGSVQVGTYLCVGPIVSALTNKFGCRPVCMAGSVIATIGFAVSTFSPNVEILILTYGVIGGFGFGMMYLPAIVSVGFYFEKKRAIATGIGVCGSGVGMFIFAPFSRYLLDTLEWKSALLILSGIVFNGMVCGMLMRPLAAPGKKKPKENVTDMISKSKPIVKNKFLVLDSAKPTSGAAYSSVPNMAMHSTRTEDNSTSKSKDKPIDASKYIASIPDDDLDRAEVEPLVQKIGFLDVEDRIHQSSPRRAHDLTFISEANLNKIKTDLSRPMYRKDIFYSGSIMNIQQFKSQPDMKDYIRSVTSIPSMHMEKTCFTCEWIPKPARDTLSEMLDVKLLKNPTFLLICFGNVLAMLGFYVPFVYIVDRAISLEIDESKAAFLLSIIGITNTIGRVLAGFLADLRKIDSLMINNVAMLLLGISTMLAPFCNTYPLLCAFAAFFGLCVAAYISLTSIIICDLLGLENLTNAFGLLTLARGISSTAGPPLAGAVYDLNNSYDTSFYLGGALVIGGALCHFLLKLPCFSTSDRVVEIGLAEDGPEPIIHMEEVKPEVEVISPPAAAKIPEIVIDSTSDREKED